MEVGVAFQSAEPGVVSMSFPSLLMSGYGREYRQGIIRSEGQVRTSAFLRHSAPTSDIGRSNFPLLLDIGRSRLSKRARDHGRGSRVEGNIRS